MCAHTDTVDGHRDTHTHTHARCSTRTHFAISIDHVKAAMWSGVSLTPLCILKMASFYTPIRLTRRLAWRPLTHFTR